MVVREERSLLAIPPISKERTAYFSASKTPGGRLRGKYERECRRKERCSCLPSHWACVCEVISWAVPGLTTRTKPTPRLHRLSSGTPNYASNIDIPRRWLADLWERLGTDRHPGQALRFYNNPSNHSRDSTVHQSDVGGKTATED